MATAPESNEFSQETKVALCVACTLATSMKPCCNGNACAFSIGRAVRELVHMRLTFTNGTKEQRKEYTEVALRTALEFPRIWAAYLTYIGKPELIVE
jgi:hypothetical protein